MKYSINYTDRMGNKPIISRTFVSSDLKTVTRQIKKDMPDIRKAVSYFGDVLVEIVNDYGEARAKGNIQINCFAGRDNLKLELL